MCVFLGGLDIRPAILNLVTRLGRFFNPGIFFEKKSVFAIWSLLASLVAGFWLMEFGVCVWDRLVEGVWSLVLVAKVWRGKLGA